MPFRNLILPMLVFAVLYAPHGAVADETEQQLQTLGEQYIAQILELSRNPEFSAVSEADKDLAKSTATEDVRKASQSFSSAQSTPPPSDTTENTTAEEQTIDQTPVDNERSEADKKAEIDRLTQARDDAKDRENSLANRGLNAVTTAAVGYGLSQALQGRAEQRSDDRWAAEINRLTNSIRCGVTGQAHNVPYNEMGQAPRESENLRKLRDEYKDGYYDDNGNFVEPLIARLKRFKERLGLSPGIESEIIMDQSAAVTGGTGRAATESDVVQRSENNEGGNRLRTGAMIAGGGAIVGLAGNWAINNKWPQIGSGKKNDSKDSWIGKFTNSNSGLMQGIDLQDLTKVANDANINLNQMNDKQREDYIKSYKEATQQGQ
ncbi:MAG: hypothetical protein FWG80_02820 [Alphaproteobacteria bacterium]|nr:hypothetical protein [Alphaproteobacteria bacterium]